MFFGWFSSIGYQKKHHYSGVYPTVVSRHSQHLKVITPTKIAPKKLQKIAFSCNNVIAITAQYGYRASPVKVYLLPDKLTLTLGQLTIKALLA
ncbi:hypothetical protein QUA00_12635 [Microcoleus sp. T2B6]